MDNSLKISSFAIQLIFFNVGHECLINLLIILCLFCLMDVIENNFNVSIPNTRKAIGYSIRL